MDGLLEFLLDRGPALVRRWQFPPQKIGQESDAEHHSATSRIAYSLAWLLRFHGIRKRIDPDAIATAAGLHDEPELITGDLPSPLKALFKDARRTVARWERRSLPMLFKGAPAPLAEHLRELVIEANDYGSLCGQITRYSDDLSALSFAEAEVQLGNTLMIPTRDNIIKTCAGRSWTWLKKLRKIHLCLP